VGGIDIFEAGLGRRPANFQPETPLSFLDWAARVYPDKLAVVNGDKRYTYRQFAERCRRFASALVKRGIGSGDTVSVMAPNSPPMLEAHFAVPMAGAVLNALNFRLDAQGIAFILGHAETKLLITDRELSPVIGPALDGHRGRIAVIDVDDPQRDLGAEGGDLLGEKDYEAFLAEGDADFQWRPPADPRQISGSSRPGSSEARTSGRVRRLCACSWTSAGWSSIRPTRSPASWMGSSRGSRRSRTTPAR